MPTVSEIHGIRRREDDDLGVAVVEEEPRRLRGVVADELEVAVAETAGPNAVEGDVATHLGSVAADGMVTSPTAPAQVHLSRSKQRGIMSKEAHRRARSPLQLTCSLFNVLLFSSNSTSSMTLPSTADRNIYTHIPLFSSQKNNNNYGIYMQVVCGGCLA